MLSTICEGAEITSRECLPTPDGSVIQPKDIDQIPYVSSASASARNTSSNATTPSSVVRKYSQHLDDYEDLGEIGRGQFGSVHKVRLKADPSAVLVWKQLDYQRMPEKEKKQLQQEVQLLQTLEHPHVVRYLGKINDKTNSHIYLLMEYCDGGDLSKYLDHTVRKGFPLPEDTILLWFSQLVDALHYCHTLPSGRVFHRDIKPQNVLICEKYKKVKLGDFGLAKMLKPQQNMAHTHVGTPYYMSPEVLNRSQYDAKSDIWSLGCLLFEMATGKSPHYKATTLDHLKSLVANGNIDKLPSIFSKELYSLILWMLTKNASQRPSTTDLRGTFAFRLGCFVGLGSLIAKVDIKRRHLDKENKQLKASLDDEKKLREEERRKHESEVERLKSEMETLRKANSHNRSRSGNLQPRMETRKTLVPPVHGHSQCWSLDRLPGERLPETLKPAFGGQSISTSTGDSSVPLSEQELPSPHLRADFKKRLATRFERFDTQSPMTTDHGWGEDVLRPSSQPVISRANSHCGTGRSTSSQTLEGKSSYSAREQTTSSRHQSLSRPAVPLIETPKKYIASPFRNVNQNPGTPLFANVSSSLLRRRAGRPVDQYAVGLPRCEVPQTMHRRSPFSTPLRRAEKLAERLPTRTSLPLDSHVDGSLNRWTNLRIGSAEKRLKSITGARRALDTGVMKRPGM
eukprot:Gregarina_sp_Pseudo_9__5692@NODE_812_length_2181_cov_12_267507_g763_i0_p1_GENE_NODE_812_length_2181_cov_12_267507_g763_i0NODE_812_length_2181_cov_12_267507_g763_i0_p1_ORF_typecomplete_len684_score2_06Pkinase/PF00069_25/2_1e72Pkinase/PF00069_25/9_8e02Pkinase/PF00069_25/1_3e03Pkinase_Tyr/PF07714_17/3_3e57Pkinase_Tyr/PF07714_17/6e03Kinaselike/PF14531_6/8_2e16Pkinase_fungal/PF17667_1/1_5e12WaaY/PF06176_11/0_00022Kdo/PF06293_14/0_00031APH/PF01636_23/0_017APH/PF01636_23/2_1e03PIP49_C/PF12260_8/0_0041D